MAMFVTGNLNLFDVESAKGFGYETVRDHLADFIEQWYEDVKSDDDHVYIIGNLSRYSPIAAMKTIRSLPGTKHLVTGPRDQISPDTKRGWEFAQEYYKTFVYTNTSIRRRIDGRDAILSFYGPDADCWWAPRQTDAYYITAWQDIPEDDGSSKISAPLVTPDELSVSWASWNRMVNWEEVKDMVAHQDIID